MVHSHSVGKLLIALAAFLFVWSLPVHAQQTIFVPLCAGADDTARFTSIITTIGSNTGTIRIPYKSPASARCAVNNLTIPSNVTLDNTDGTGIKVNSGYTLTVNGPRVNPVGKTMFYGPGVVVMNGNTYAFEPKSASLPTYEGNAFYDAALKEFLGTSESNKPAVFLRATSAAIGQIVNVAGSPYNAKCDGTTDDTAAIVAADIVASLANETLYLPPSATGCKIADATLTSRISSDGGSFFVADGAVLVISTGSITAPADVFLFRNATAGHGTVSFAGNKILSVVTPEWWGGGEAMTATVNTAALQAADYALATKLNGIIAFGTGTYHFNDTVYVGATTDGGDGFGNFTTISLIGTGGFAFGTGTTLRYDGPTDRPFLKITRGRFNEFRRLTIYNAGSRGTAVGTLETGPEISMQTHGVLYEHVSWYGWYKGDESGDTANLCRSTGLPCPTASEMPTWINCNFVDNTYGFYAGSNFNSLGFPFFMTSFQGNDYGIHTETGYQVSCTGCEAGQNKVDFYISGHGNTFVVNGFDAEVSKQFIISANGAGISVTSAFLRGYVPNAGDPLITLSGGSGALDVQHTIRGLGVGHSGADASGPFGPQVIGGGNGFNVTIEGCAITNIDVFKNNGTYGSYDGSLTGVSYRIKGVSVNDSITGQFLYWLPDDEGVMGSTTRDSNRTLVGNQGYNYVRRVQLQSLNRLRGLSSTSTPAANLRGQYTFTGGDAGVKAITFQRTVSDGVMPVAGQVTATSATAAFTPFDAGRRIAIGKGRAPIISIASNGVHSAASLFTTANAYATINSSGVITAVTLYATCGSGTDPCGGSGYGSAPTVTVFDPFGIGSGAVITASISGGIVTGFTVTNGGSNYGYLVTAIDSYTSATSIELGASSFGATTSTPFIIGQNEPDANYIIMITGSENETFKVTSKSTTGFTVTSSNNASTATFDWLLVR